MIIKNEGLIDKIFDYATLGIQSMFFISVFIASLPFVLIGLIAKLIIKEEK